MYLEKNMIQKDTCTQVFTAALFTIARHGNNLLSIDRGIDKKMCSRYTMEYYSAMKKNKIMPFVGTWKDLECVILGEISDREGEISYDIPYMWNLKRNDTSELCIKKRLAERDFADLENRFIVARWKG